MPGKTVVILGGGVGGLTTAKYLARWLPAEHRIVLVEQKDRHCFAPSLLWLIFGWREPEKICRPLRLLVDKRVDLVQATVEEIDLKGGAVKADGKVIGYDYLVVSLGARLAYEAAPGLFPTAYSFYELDQAVRLRDAVRTFAGGKVAIVIPSVPYKCPPAPYELALLMDYWLHKKGARTISSVAIYTPEPTPLQAAGPAAGQALLGMLQQRNIRFVPGHRWTKVDPDKRVLTFENGAQAEYDLLIAIPPHQAPAVVRAAGLTDQRGWVPVDKGTLRTQHPNVYALGDVTIIPLPTGFALPKAGVFAHAQGKIVARNLVSAIAGGQQAQFNGYGACFLETGYGKAGFVSGIFYTQEGFPNIRLRPPAWWWHWAKVLFERRWLAGNF
ncbi:MAG: NAD(P)/FAD-dependent oxidoreductase [Dehalococcoidia bacterium]|nr:NAD(P)/FAD-dependent oxidoreductase [Dehalococcoidia bacterium]MDW8119168.1 FAD/NAD(P)-binding oxidoreductase [Chloroflexota bacterium]